jgi:hypothetical protein
MEAYTHTRTPGRVEQEYWNAERWNIEKALGTP